MRVCTLVAAGTMALSVVACGGDDASSGDDGASGGASAGGAAGMAGTTSDGARPSGGCESPEPVAVGDETRTLVHDGRDRTYNLHVPDAYDPSTPGPIVLNVHGLTPIVGAQAASTQASLSKMVPKSDSAGFVLVHPQGLLESDGSTAAWNAGACCSADGERDDLGFIDALIDRLMEDLCLDERRVYVTGLSNGAMMSHFLGCSLAGKVAAIAPVAGVNPTNPCEPGRPVGVIAFHGTSDSLVPYSGGAQAVEDWARRNGCDSTPVETFANGDSRCEHYPGCDADVEVELCTVEDGGHTWPGGTDLPTPPGFPDLGKTTQDLVANDAMWDFFSRHRLP